MVPSKYIQVDNQLQLSIERERNNGRLAYSLALKTDINKALEGVNLIESLILTNEDTSLLFELETLDLHDGNDIRGT